MKCGRPISGDWGDCGICGYCPRCHRVVDEIHIYQDGDNSYCVWCEKDYLAEKAAGLEADDLPRDDEDVGSANGITLFIVLLIIIAVIIFWVL